ncbi:MAG: 50S ribosomal protein L23 [Planctomycetes bacterium]|nr:50S ribosomal protein L23 [Planctomycetota bacterium]
MDPHAIVLSPRVSEKGMAHVEDRNQYTFAVARGANKIEIARAVAALFKVKVVRVRTMNMRGKSRRIGWIRGKKPAWKKAVVKLAEGERIDLF